jgi:hypothetical protein
MSYHTIKATVWQTTPEGATIKVFNPLPSTEIEHNIDIEDLRTETLKKAYGEVVYQSILALVKDGKELIDPNLEIRIKIDGKSTEVRTTKTY